MKRRLWIAALAGATVLVASLGLAACGFSGHTEGLEYRETEDGESYLVSGFVTASNENLGSYRVDVSIPALYRDKPVVGIAEDAFRNKDIIRSVELPATVVSIGDGAFSGCRNLSSVTLGEGLLSIGARAFSDCTALSGIGLPDDLETIGEEAFMGSGLRAVTVPDKVADIGTRAFYECNQLGLRNDASDGVISLGSGITHIGEDAFANTNYYYQDSNWTQGVLYIGNYLLCARDTVEGSCSVTGGTRVIADHAFEDCSLLTGISLPGSIVSVGTHAFAYCNRLDSIEIASNTVYSSAGNCLVEKATDTLVVGCMNTQIPSTVKAIGDYAFFGATELESVTLPTGLLSIGASAFYDCRALEAVALPAELTSLSAFAFAKCASLQTAEIPAKVTTVAHDVFLDCEKLEWVILPEALERVEENAFAGCYLLSKAYFRGNADAWDEIYFIGSENKRLTDAEIYFYAAQNPQEDGHFWHESNGLPAIW